MPIQVGAEIRRLDEAEFKARAYEVMGHVFAVHNELGRLFDEKIYQREIAFRTADAQREVPVNVIFEEFRKRYFLDLLVAGGAVFEFKAVDALTDRHRRQLLHYLFLTDLPHGKLVNLRPERVEYEFVNSALSFADRTSFSVAGSAWEEVGTACLMDRMIALLRDWGTGLDVGLYEEAAATLPGQSGMETEVAIHLGPRSLGVQRMPLVAPGVGLRVTALAPDRHRDLETHLGRFLDHTDLRAVQWINITRPLVQFKTIQRKGK